jgi:hypothetical protein
VSLEPFPSILKPGLAEPGGTCHGRGTPRTATQRTALARSTRRPRDRTTVERALIEPADRRESGRERRRTGEDDALRTPDDPVEALLQAERLLAAGSSALAARVVAPVLGASDPVLRVRARLLLARAMLAGGMLRQRWNSLRPWHDKLPRRGRPGWHS